MHKGFVSAPVLLALIASEALAAASCDGPQDVIAIHTAALQQELMVAAFMCRDVDAYNAFVLSHQGALQDADRALTAYFQRTDPGRAFAAYNLYKTDLANASSLRSTRDPWFCTRANANFQAATGRTLEQLLAQTPYPVASGAVDCPWAAAPVQASTPSQPPQPRPKRIRHRTWLGRLIDALFH
jgi:hypothetical protein